MLAVAQVSRLQKLRMSQHLILNGHQISEKKETNGHLRGNPCPRFLEGSVRVAESLQPGMGAKSQATEPECCSAAVAVDWAVRQASRQSIMTMITPFCWRAIYFVYRRMIVGMIQTHLNSSSFVPAIFISAILNDMASQAYIYVLSGSIITISVVELPLPSFQYQRDESNRNHAGLQNHHFSPKHIYVFAPKKSSFRITIRFKTWNTTWRATLPNLWSWSVVGSSLWPCAMA